MSDKPIPPAPTEVNDKPVLAAVALPGPRQVMWTVVLVDGARYSVANVAHGSDDTLHIHEVLVDLPTYEMALYAFQIAIDRYLRPNPEPDPPLNCPSLDIHPEHEWDLNGLYPRTCPGRTTSGYPGRHAGR